MPERSDELFRLKAEVLRSLAHPLRLKIVEFLKSGEKCVCEIVQEVKAERTGISKHLSILYKSGILCFRKDGKKILYKLQMPCALNFLDCAEDIIKKQIKLKEKIFR